MKRSLRLLSLMLAVLMALSVCSLSASAAFADVTDYADAIETLASVKIILGYNDTTFSPNTKVTRWMMALLVAKMESGNCNSGDWSAMTTDIPFTDIEGYQYPSAIKYCVDKGWVVGRSATVYDPNAEITLKEALTFVIRALGYPKAQYDLNWPVNYINKGIALGLMKNLSGVSFDQTLTRGQVAQLLFNAFFIKRVDPKTMSETKDPFCLNTYTYTDPAGNTSTYTAFMQFVLAATPTMTISSMVTKPAQGNLKFAQLNANGTLGAQYAVPASLFSNSDVSNSTLGRSYRMILSPVSGSLLYCQACDVRTITSGLTVDADKNTVSMLGQTYSVVGSYTYSLKSGVKPTAPQIIVYGLNHVYTSLLSTRYCPTYQIYSASLIKGTTGVFSMNLFDDNGDGLYDRAIYTPYAFGKLTVSSDGTIPIADNKKVTVTGAAAPKNSFVYYSYNSQTMELDIRSTVSTISGTVTAIDTDKQTITIGTQTYSIGDSEVLYATYDDNKNDLPPIGASMIAVIKGTSVLYVEPDSVRLLLPQHHEKAYVGNDYGIIISIEAYSFSFAPVLIKVMTPIENGQEEIRTLGITVETLSTYGMPKVGDLIAYTKDEKQSQVYEQNRKMQMQTGVPLPTVWGVVNYTLLNDQDTFTMDSTITMWYDDTTKTVEYRATKDGKELSTSRDANPTTKIVTYNPNSGSFTDYPATNYTKTNPLTVPIGYSVLIVMGGAGIEKRDTLVYIRPTVESVEIIEANDYTTFAYIDSPSTAAKTETAKKDVYNVTYTARDVFTGAKIQVTLRDCPKAELPTEKGYYCVMEKSDGTFVMTDKNPVTESMKNKNVGVLLDVQLESVQNEYTPSQHMVLKDNKGNTYLAKDVQYLIISSFGGLIGTNLDIFYKVVESGEIADTLSLGFNN